MPTHLPDPLSESDRARLNARAYDLVHRGTPGDLAFYRRHAASGRHVLELGCGTGRLLVPIACDSVPIVGLDLDPARLAVARARLDSAGLSDTPLIQGDMRTFRLEPRFDRVFIPYNALCALPDDASVLACLQRVAAHLAPDGQLIFDVYYADEAALTATVEPATAPEHIMTAVDSEGRVEVWEQECPLADPRRIDMVYAYHMHPTGGGPHVIAHETIPHLLLPRDLLRVLLEQSGLQVAAEWGDFAGSECDDDSESYVCLAVPAPVT